MKKIILLTFLLLITFGFLSAENQPQTVFETELAVDAPKIDEKGLAEKYTFDLLQRLKSHKESLANGNASAFNMGTPPRDFYKFYASTYLLCSIQHGTCQEFLDSILEIDIINSKVTGKASCLNTLKMWKAWIDNDMEKRHSHQTKITDIGEVSKFNKEERPRYHRCNKTIQDLIADSTVSSGEFFKKRYSSAVKTEDYIQKTLDFLQFVKDKNLDIYATVGM